MSEFDDIIENVKIEQDVQRGRIALVFMFDELPGTTMFDLQELVRDSIDANQDNKAMQNLTITAAWRSEAQQIEDLCTTALEQDPEDGDVL
jgi:hypothetical protein